MKMRTKSSKNKTEAAVDSEYSKGTNAAATTGSSSQKKENNGKSMKRHLILVPNTKESFCFCLNLDKSYLKHNEVELPALGMGNDKMEALVDSEHSKSTSAATTTDSLPLKEKRKKRNNVILVSNTKKPFGFYLNLANSYLEHYKEVELSALGSEIKVSKMDFKEDNKGRMISKPKIQIVLGRAGKLNYSDIDEQDAEKA